MNDNQTGTASEEPALCRRHVDEDTAAYYLRHELTVDAEDEFERHFFDCALCWERLQALELLAKAAGTPPRPRARRPARAPLFAAAALVLVAGAGAALWRSSPAWFQSAPPTLRGAALEGQLLEPVGPVPPSASVVFRWKAHPDARAYTLHVADLDGEERLTKTTTETSVTADPSLVPAGQQLFWWIDVQRTDGTTQTVPPVRFRTEKK